MKNKQRGFSLAILIVIIAILIIGIGLYMYFGKIIMETGLPNAQDSYSRGQNALSVTHSNTKSDITFSVFNSSNSLRVSKGGISLANFTLDTDATNALSVTPDIQRFITDLDVNFDGYNDVGVFTITGYGGVNNYYDFYIYNPQTEKFLKSSTLTEISNPSVEIDKKQVISSYRSGPEWYKDTYQFNGSTYIKTKTTD